jgi:hypothetical protein
VDPSIVRSQAPIATPSGRGDDGPYGRHVPHVSDPAPALRATASPRRILVPIGGRSVPPSDALEVALRGAVVERATVVAAFLMPVPMRLALDDATAGAPEPARPALEVFERYASRAGVSVECRIERGRTYRHALRQLVDRESYERVVVIPGAAGLAAADIAWLLGHAGGDIVVVRPAAAGAGRGRACRRRPDRDG